MQLYARIQGSGPPVVLLHGLFGSNENLGVIARALAGDFTTYSLDLRNHGRSPHADSMDYPALAADVAETLDAHDVGAAAVVGHSLGGKTAMELALSYPERVSRLAVIDIAPIEYGRRHDQELQAMRSLDLGTIRSRTDADRALAQAIPNPAVRQFLLKNLVRSDGGFAWRIPLDTIANNYAAIAAAPTSRGSYRGPALFVRGGHSDYIPRTAERTIRERFPAARIETVDGGAHWVHVDSLEPFLELLRPFLVISSATPGSQ